MKITAKAVSEIRFIWLTWKTISANWMISLAAKFVFILFALSLAVIIWRWPLLPPMLPLWYAKPWGADQLAGSYWLFILPLGSLIIFFANIILCVYLASDLLVFSQVLSLTSFVVSLLSFITLTKILFLVT